MKTHNPECPKCKTIEPSSDTMSPTHSFCEGEVTNLTCPNCGAKYSTESHTLFTNTLQEIKPMQNKLESHVLDVVKTLKGNVAYINDTREDVRTDLDMNIHLLEIIQQLSKKAGIKSGPNFSERLNNAKCLVSETRHNHEEEVRSEWLEVENFLDLLEERTEQLKLALMTCQDHSSNEFLVFQNKDGIELNIQEILEGLES